MQYDIKMDTREEEKWSKYNKNFKLKRYILQETHHWKLQTGYYMIYNMKYLNICIFKKHIDIFKNNNYSNQIITANFSTH